MASDLLGTLYKAMTGLNAFTRGLDNLSNNVANLNTVGYKANDVFYRELEGNQQFGSTGDDGSPIANGQGVAVGGTTVRFVDGEGKVGASRASQRGKRVPVCVCVGVWLCRRPAGAGHATWSRDRHRGPPPASPPSSLCSPGAPGPAGGATCAA